MLWLTRTESARTAAPSFLGAEVNHWLGMSQSALQWPIHTRPLQAMQQEQLPNKLLTGSVKSTPNCQQLEFQPAAVELASQPCRFWSTRAARFLNVLANRLEYSFYSSGSVS